MACCRPPAATALRINRGGADIQVNLANVFEFCEDVDGSLRVTRTVRGICRSHNDCSAPQVDQHRVVFGALEMC